MLCDRNSTNVRNSQPGFIQFVTMPLFQAFKNMFPQLEEAVDNLKANNKLWQ